MLRPLLIGAAELEAAQKVASYASEQAHWYRPGESERSPGDIPEHVLRLGTYRCVFSYTTLNEKVFRHLSISVPVKGKLPNPIAAYEIASLLGFTGWSMQEGEMMLPKGWQAAAHPKDNCVVLAQEVE